MHHTFFKLHSEEGPYMSGAEFEEGNLGHRPGIKGGYFPVPPVDSGTDLRAEMVTVMAEMGLTVEKHHHEVAPSQHELGIKFDTLVRCADNMQIYKYVVQNVAHSYGKTATFMPKPVAGDNGSGMHTHQSIWKDGKPLFAGDGYAGLSERRSTTSAASSSTPAPSTPSPTPRPTATSAWSRASRRRCCWPIPGATARPPAASPTAPARTPSGSRCASPIRRRIPTWPSPPC